MTKRLLVTLVFAAYASVPLAAQAPAPGGPPPPPPTGKVDPGEPANQPRAAHDHDGDGMPDHSPEEHGGGRSGVDVWEGIVGPALFIVLGLGAIGVQRAMSVKRHRQMTSP